MVLRDQLLNVFFFEYFPSAMSIGDILNMPNGESLKGINRYSLFTSFSFKWSTSDGCLRADLLFLHT